MVALEYLKFYRSFWNYYVILSLQKSTCEWALLLITSSYIITRTSLFFFFWFSVLFTIRWNFKTGFIFDAVFFFFYVARLNCKFVYYHIANLSRIFIMPFFMQINTHRDVFGIVFFILFIEISSAEFYSHTYVLVYINMFQFCASLIH